MSQVDYTVHVHRPDEGPHANQFVLTFYCASEVVKVRAYSPARKREMNCILRKAGRTSLTRIQWDRIFDGRSLTIYIEKPANWFWSKTHEKI